MHLARVMGTVVATVKADGLEGVRFLIIQPLDKHQHDTGTPVVAARSGIVTRCFTLSSIGGADNRFQADANRIVVNHSDGTVAIYFHLAKEGALVRVGEFVLRGEVIGLSGATGYAASGSGFMLWEEDRRELLARVAELTGGRSTSGRRGSTRDR